MMESSATGGKNAIEVRGIGKQYRLGAAGGDRQYNYKSLRDPGDAARRDCPAVR